MECQILFSRKNKENISKCHLLKFLPQVLSYKGKYLKDSCKNSIKKEKHLLNSLTPKAPITTAADDNIFIFFYFLFYFSEKTSLDISCESSAWQMIHMKCQDLFSLKNN